MKYSDLRVWQEAMNLVTEVYRMTKPFPSEEKYGLASQIQRAAVSVPSNIAEGHGRKSTNAFLNHLSIAFGSLMELENPGSNCREAGIHHGGQCEPLSCQDRPSRENDRRAQEISEQIVMLFR